MPIVIVPPPAHPTVSDGYAAAQECRAVLDPLDFVQCENQSSMRFKSMAERSPDFTLGYAIAVYVGADRIEQKLEAAPPSPAVARNLAVAGNVVMAGRVAVELAAKKAGVGEGDIPTLVLRISGSPQERWSYWRAKPLPDWLAKQAKDAKPPL
jgi:hypothetical protein